MRLTLFITDDCSACIRAERKIKEVIKNRSDVSFFIRNLKDAKPPSVFIVPALFIDDKLYLYGEVDSNKLIDRINSNVGR